MKSGNGRPEYIHAHTHTGTHTCTHTHTPSIVAVPPTVGVSLGEASTGSDVVVATSGGRGTTGVVWIASTEGDAEVASGGTDTAMLPSTVVPLSITEVISPMTGDERGLLVGSADGTDVISIPGEEVTWAGGEVTAIEELNTVEVVNNAEGTGVCSSSGDEVTCPGSEVTAIEELNTMEVVNNAEGTGVSSSSGDEVTCPGAEIREVIDAELVINTDEGTGVDLTGDEINSAMGDDSATTELEGIGVNPIPDMTSATDDETEIGALDVTELESSADGVGVSSTPGEGVTRTPGDDTTTGVLTTSIVENTKVTFSEELVCVVVNSAMELEGDILEVSGASSGVGVGVTSTDVDG